VFYSANLIKLNGGDGGGESSSEKFFKTILQA